MRLTCVNFQAFPLNSFFPLEKKKSVLSLFPDCTLNRPFCDSVAFLLARSFQNLYRCSLQVTNFGTVLFGKDRMEVKGLTVHGSVLTAGSSWQFAKTQTFLLVMQHGVLPPQDI